MRLIYTTHDADQGQTLATFLSSEGIQNQLEVVKNTDWGTADYGTSTFKIWVYDEDAAEAGEKWAEAFEKDPKNARFQKTTLMPTILSPILPKGTSESKPSAPKTIHLMDERSKTRVSSPSLKPEAIRTITAGLILLCCLFYFISSLTTPNVNAFPANLPATPILSAPIKKLFLYDYPRAYELIDKLVKLYGIDKLQAPETLPLAGQYLLKEFQTTPYWEGYYSKLMAYLQQIERPKTAPLFEKIKQGEGWRLFTPCLMHNDFLHILFNMLWLLVLGKQLEQRLQAKRYLLFILIVGIVSNTCQYLMSGPNFIGFSGVICGMVTFIWVRQKVTPWEGYPLEQATSMFILYFICALLAIQVVSFYMEIYHTLSISPGIANTAHFSGAAAGALLGLLPFFKKNAKFARPEK